MNKIIIIAFLILLIIVYLIDGQHLQYEKFSNEYILPKTIYTFWHSDDVDPIVKMNIENWKNKLPDWTIHVITMNNIDKFIPESYYSQFYDIIYQHFADHMRLYLLEKYGGVWMDGGIVIIDAKFINDQRNKCIAGNKDAVLFEYGSRSTKHPHLENWFIMAPRGSKLIKDWKNDFDQCHFDGPKKCRENILKCGVDITNTIKNDDYLAMHAIINCLSLRNKYNLDIYEAADSMFYIQTMHDWNNDKIINYLFSDQFNSNKNIYMIKFTGGTRKALNRKTDEYQRFVLTL